ncbi:hypothetical protein GC425_04715 [Corynebacterium sp. zg254]|uniref:Secreted protein n=1 Tax=Corynebacterium zhongnanshanii TaxID=2768834 RepID=A0ABQ6VEB4_9CORY|nr:MULTISPECIES: hypothetical protein [Corynebacterium]KAB3522764.1 hypothetical protein F8377_00900 [Corynebacterium zhongnanshanii]MCR5914174.1 hypothetical protein [Corynebacterium sp. zg254]
MPHVTTISRYTAIALASTALVFVPAAQAAPVTSNQSNQQDAGQDAQGTTRIEYRSEEDRLAFEKLGRYIKVSEDGTVSAHIPSNVRHSNEDAADRIDEFVAIANGVSTSDDTPTITTYGNETKIDRWGPIEKVYISHDVLSKVNKLVTAGADVAGITSLLVAEGLSGPIGWVAAGVMALAGAGSLCDWNDQGIIIWQVPGVPVPACTPQK